MKRAAEFALMMAGLLATWAGGALPPSAAASPAIMAFSGSCAFSGHVRFEPPITNTPQSVRDIATASGTCSGTLTDSAGRTHTLNAAPVAYLATDQGSDVSCALSPHATGSGELVFPEGKLRFALSETRASGVATLSLSGRGGASATGTANISPSANPALVVEQCAGTGLASAPIDINIHTTPTISG